MAETILLANAMSRNTQPHKNAGSCYRFIVTSQTSFHSNFQSLQLLQVAHCMQLSKRRTKLTCQDTGNAAATKGCCLLICPRIFRTFISNTVASTTPLHDVSTELHPNLDALKGFKQARCNSPKVRKNVIKGDPHL